jgi:Fe-Mn family superoxide dismutase
MMTGQHVLPPLPYAYGALHPHISEETLKFHHGKHHQTYVDNLNKFVSQDSTLVGKTLGEIIRTAQPGPVLNNAAQVWNHTFYWKSMSANGGGKPTGEIAGLIDRDFGSFDEFKAEFSAAASGHFASGWAWLVQGR